MNDYNSIFLLKRDGGIEAISESLITAIDPYSLSLVLIPNKVYDGFSYIPVEPMHIYNIKHVDISCTITVHEQEYMDDHGISNVMYTDIFRTVLIADTIPDFYRAICSLHWLSGINDYLNLCPDDFFCMFGVRDQVVNVDFGTHRVNDVMRTSKYKISPHASECSDSISLFIRHIERLMTIRSDKTICTDKNIPPLFSTDTSDIVIRHGRWGYQDQKKCDMILTKSRAFGTYTMVNRIDIELLKRFYDVKIYYCMVNGFGATELMESNPSVFMIEELTDYYEVLYTNEIPLYSADYMVEIISHYKYFLHALKVFADAIYGTIMTDIIVTLECPVERINGKYTSTPFQYNVSIAYMDDETDYYSEIISGLRDYVDELEDRYK